MGRANVIGRGLAIVALAGAALVPALGAGASPTLGATAARPATATAGVVVVDARLAYSRRTSAGTGIVLTASGQVLTNNHVIRGAGSIRVTDVATGRAYAATVAGYSVVKDVALLELRGARGLTTAVTARPGVVAVGDRVTAVGNAGGSGTLSTKSGKVTALRQTITVGDDGSPVRLTGLIETSAALRPGDSGGPLLRGGRVVGMNTATSTGPAFRGGNQGYAIPIGVALDVMRRVETGRSTSTVHVGPTAFLGVVLGEATYYRRGVRGAIVEGVASGSPAAKAGIGADDLIVSFAGRRVSSADALKRLVLRSRPGQLVRIAWIDPYRGRTSATARLVAGPPQ